MFAFSTGLPRNRRRLALHTLFSSLFLTVGTASPQSLTAEDLYGDSHRAQQLITESAHPLATNDLSAFFDALVPLEIQQQDIAGAVVVVVKDGEILYEKGYGHADVASSTPIEPEATLFRAGSVSKLFTWVAVMQQVAEGHIDLDRDVNDYLDFRIPATFVKPITMRSLMTYTPGFEDAWKDLIVGEGHRRDTLSTYLKTHLPERVLPPGELPAYSNYGSALAGYVVERVSGEPFEQYMQRHVFGPLGMASTTFGQPLVPPLRARLASGYALASGTRRPFEFISAVPAAGATTSASDAARFMVALLGNGTTNGDPVLSKHGVEEMLSDQFTVNQALSHMTLGFDEQRTNGLRIVGHGGDTQFFHSNVFLIPDAKVGFFVAVNSAGKGDYNVRDYLFRSFLDRYFPDSEPLQTRYAGATKDASTVAGEYSTTRRPVTNLFSFTSLFSNINVTALKDGDLVVDGLNDVAGHPKIWREISPLLYRATDGDDLIGFTNRPHGEIVLSTDVPFLAWTKTSFTNSKNWNLFLIEFVAGTSIITLICWPLAIWTKKRDKRSDVVSSRPNNKSQITMRLVATLYLGIIVWWLTIARNTRGILLFDSTFDVVLRCLQILDWLCFLSIGPLLFLAIRSRLSAGQPGSTRFAQASILASSTCFGYLLLHWHLLNWSLRY